MTPALSPAAVAFLAVGMIYGYYDIHKAAIFGIALEGCELLSVLVYLGLVWYVPQSEPDAGLVKKSLLSMGVLESGGGAPAPPTRMQTWVRMNSVKPVAIAAGAEGEDREAMAGVAGFASVDGLVRGLAHFSHAQRGPWQRASGQPCLHAARRVIACR